MSGHSNVRLGQIISPDEVVNRDAIHVAVVPCVAGEQLYTRSPVRLRLGSTDVVVSAHVITDANCIGIVDPFLDALWVQEGARCWVLLKPNTVTGLRHEWTHPAFDEVPAPRNDSERWLRQFADKWNFDYDQMMAAAAEPGGYVTARGIDLHGADEIGAEDLHLFWQHVGIMHGRSFDTEHRSNFGWSCSC